jgi:divalent metal cation (Fe/Co/Zn/Cd) transporter
VAATFFLLAAYVAFEAVGALLSGEGPESSAVGLVLSVVSLLVMPALAYAKQRTGREMGSGALRADAVETWVCSYLSLALLAGVGLNATFGWWWADPAGALAMLPVILWQGWETLGEARECEENEGGEEVSGTVRRYRPGFSLWWVTWVVIGMAFFFAVAYGFGW